MIRPFAATLVFALTAAPALAQGSLAPSAPGTQFTISADSAPVYKAPTMASPVIGQAARGSVLPVTRELGSWVRVPWPPGPDGEAFVHVSMGSVSHAAAGSGSSYIAADIARTSASVTGSQSTASSNAFASSAGASHTSSQQSQYVGLPSHTIGAGLVMASDHFVFGASGRVWSPHWVGAQLQLTHQSFSQDANHYTTVAFAPSVVVSMPQQVSDYLSFRPYVGSGLTFSHVNQRPGSVDAVSSSKSVTGMQLFGGGELTFASLPQVGVSVDLGYHHAGESFEGIDGNGLALSAAAHWYFR